MRKIMTAGAVGLVLSAPLPAAAAVSEQEVAELRQQVEALLQRVQQLEAREASAGGAPPAARVEEIEQRLADIETTNDNQTDKLAQAAAVAKSADWATKLKWKGDFRYRHEMIQEETRDDRTRQRIRARLGLDAKLSDTLSAGLQIAAGDPLDPRSTNATLGAANIRKNVALDQAYVNWRAFADTTVTAGKQSHPWYRPGGSLLYDGDVNPEGVAVKWGGKAGPFANGWGLWLSEESSGADANLVGGQVGWATRFGLTVALTYQDFGALQNSTLVFNEFPAGNSTYLGNSACNLPAPGTGATQCYVYDYDILGLSAEFATTVGALPLSLWGDYIENQDPGDLNTGYNVGFRLGKASNPGSWELALLYQDVEKDAQWGGFIDSDFAGGATQGKGMQFKGGWVPAKNVALNLTWFDNTRNYDTASERDYQRLQLDFNFKF